MSGRNGALPSGWQWTTLGELCHPPQYGWTTKAAQEGQTRLLRTTDITRGSIDWNSVPYCLAEPPDPDKYRLRSGDIVVSRAGSVGFSALITDPPNAVFASYLIRFRPIDPEMARYLAWFMRSPGYWRAIGAQSVGIALANVNAKKLAAIRVPVPPRELRRRIVQQLDEDFASVAEGERRLRDALADVERYRLAVMRDAVAGPWPRVPLRSVLTSLRNGIFVSRPAASPPGVPIFRISAVRPMALNTDDIRYAPTDTPDHERFLTQPGDLLFTRYSGNAEYVGACARVPDSAPPTLHPDKLIRGVVDRSKADPAFLELACSSGQTWQEIRARRKTTAGQVGIAGKQLGEVTIPLPPLDKQQEIVSATAERLCAADVFTERIQGALADVDNLRAALLHQALTPRETVAVAPRTGAVSGEVPAGR